MSRSEDTPIQAVSLGTIDDLVASMPRSQIISLLEATQNLNERQAFKNLEQYEPYDRQLEWLCNKSPINTMWGGNQVGKSLTAAVAVVYHATGLYPDWWTGRRLTGPSEILCVGLTNESTRDTCQKKIIGPDIDSPGRGGLLRPELIIDKPSRRTGVPNAVDTIKVRHVSGGVSYIMFKSSEMGREKLQGMTLDIVWMDEEPDRDIFDELLMRLIKKKGQMLMTFTPLKGMSDLCIFLMEDESGMVNRTVLPWAEAKHLDEEEREKIKKLYGGSQAQLDARMNGMPTFGSGLVYPFEDESLFHPRFKLETWWPRLGAIDPGWRHPTACVTAALDPDSDIIYIYNQYAESEKPVSTHASAIKRFGDIDYAMDPAANQSDKAGGAKLMELYLDEFHAPGEWQYINPSKRRIFNADNSVMAGINSVYERFEQGKLFIFDDLDKIRKEIKLYRWDETAKGTPRVVKKYDDLMDTIRYLVMASHRFRKMGSTRENETVVVEQWRPAQRGY